MSDSHLRLLVLSLLLLCCVSPSSLLTINFNFTSPIVGLVSCRPRQIQAFTRFKNEFDTSHCNNNDDLNGAWCDKVTGEITKLRLRDCLSGTLKPNSSLFGFHQLRYVDLNHNNFPYSSLPSEFGKLNKLEVLSLSSCGFIGQVPSSFDNLSQLSYLDLSRNDLLGSLPLVRNLRNLTILDLSYNHFYVTLNPNSSLFELHYLRYLNLGYNYFRYSSLPSEFGNLNKLEVLCLSSNGFLGQVPPTISNLTMLTELYLTQNSLTGSLPLVLNLTKLSTLDLSENQFSGTIPSSLFTMPSLSKLYLSRNNLEGSIEAPNSSTSSRLEILYLGNNNFEEQILEPVSKLINLKFLDLSFLNTSYVTDLSLFSSLKSLVFLDFSGNNISPASLSSNLSIPLTLEVLRLEQCGIMKLPNILRALQNLKYIEISNNIINGEVPGWLWSLPHLSYVDIGNNYFTGFEGSAEVLVNSSVQCLMLDSNKFEGALPDLPLTIKAFYAGNNNLEGYITDALCAGASLRTLDVGFNRLTGKLPRSLVNCSSLKFLSVRNNRIEDTFPFWLKALPNLRVLILRSNKFYGPIC